MKTTKRTQSGRYVIRLPFVENFQLGDSSNRTLEVSYAFDRKFESDPNLSENYYNFMEDCNNLDHMKFLSANFLCIYAHHAVIHNNRSITKLGAVFNVSALFSNEHSLNSVFLEGPKPHTKIFFNLMKFRQYKIVLTADITKMYSQI